MSLIAYGLIALAIMASIGGAAWKIRESGKDAIRVEWQAANAKAAADAEADRQRQDALRASQDKQATRRLADEKKRTAGLMVSLEAHIKAAGKSAQCPVPASLFDAWNAANAGPQGVGPGAVPPVGPKPAPPR